MPGLQHARIVVAGAGALGSSIALELATAGAHVTLADPAPLAGNASGVAAGMLAPAFEALLEAGSEQHLPLLRSARDHWPELAARLGDIGLRRSGAVWIDLPDETPLNEVHASRLRALGVECEILTSTALRQILPDLAGMDPGLYTGEDWRLEPRTALSALRRIAMDSGARIMPRAVSGFETGRVRFAGGEAVPADALVLATGPDPLPLAPELSAISPIKGQILRYAETLSDDDQPIIRCADGYAVPARDGLRIGATMEPGVSDRRVDPRTAGLLGRLSVELFPALDGATFLGQAGVRATTPDGLPLVGPSARPGVFLAVGARRNGWLLAPLVARMIAAYLADRDPGPFTGALAAGRFAAA